jgi:hypothetical protein
MLLMIPGIFHAQVNLNASALLGDDTENLVAGVRALFEVLTSCAVYTQAEYAFSDIAMHSQMR